jgi:hypothetical protein
MNATIVKQSALPSVREQAEKTIAELEILNEKGLSIEQVEHFLVACAVLRSGRVSRFNMVCNPDWET